MKSRLLIVIFALAACVTSGLTVHYRIQAGRLAAELTAQEDAVAAFQKHALAAQRSEALKTSATVPVPLAATNAMSDEDIRQLEARLQEKDKVIASLRQERDAAQTNRDSRVAQPWRDPQAWLQQIKETDPERYKQIQDQREKSRQNMEKAFAEKADHFLNRDTSDMTDDERTNYTRMLTLLDQTWKLADQLRTELPPDQRRPISRALHDNVEILTPMLETERAKEFYQLGRDVGYTDEEAQQFASYVSNIIDITSMRPVFQNMRPASGGFPRDRGGSRSSTPGAP